MILILALSSANYTMAEISFRKPFHTFWAQLPSFCQREGLVGRY